MRLPGSRLIADWRAMGRFHALPTEHRRIVFYAETASDWAHLGPIVRELTATLGQHVCCVTSSPSDPILGAADERLHALCIGAGAVRTAFFSRLPSCVMVMTLPELESLYLKRSRVARVDYVYVFHSLVSTHMVYRPGAFDHYDEIFLAGPHHGAEIRAAERSRGLPAKRLFAHGYGRLDALLAEAARLRAPRAAAGRKLRVLLAPSWGPEGLLESHGAPLVAAILGAGYALTVRPHPMTRARWAEAIRRLERFRGGDCLLESDIGSVASLLEADVMVSDWSGAALEFALGLERPVLFVDVPRKVNNPGYAELGIEPVEVGLRGRLGTTLRPSELGRVGDALRALCAGADGSRETIRRVRAEVVYNEGRSGPAAAERLAELLRERSA
jgi:YidC/Oxa1 family membrane protein insertase